MPENVIIMGAAGRDFHNFNTFFRANPDLKVVAFTAAQIPNIDDRDYPPELAGEHYPKGIPIHPEAELVELIKQYKVSQVFFSYSDLNYKELMNKASVALSAGADFRLLGPENTMIRSKKPMLSICAVRTGAGKSPTTRMVSKLLRDRGLKVIVIRHPMPYGRLSEQIWQRFATYEDLDKHKCTIEEREEYEPHIDNGIIVYAGVDYGEILKRAEDEADVIIWDGGNNDLPFYRPDVHLVVTDPHRVGHEENYYPGEANLRMADYAIINKVKTADPNNIETLRGNIGRIAPGAEIIMLNSPYKVDDPGEIKGKKVLVVEDGPTVTHGEMPYGAGYLAANEFGAGEIIDPRPYAKGSLVGTFEKYSHLEFVLPAMGYGKDQVGDLEATINACECDLVLSGTPIDLSRLFKPDKKLIRVKYYVEEIGEPGLTTVVDDFIKKFVENK